MTGEFREKARLLDEAAMDRAITRLSHEILEKNNGAENVVLIGIRRRGYPLALRIAGKIKAIEGVTVPVGAMDITFYRDDLSKKNDQPVVSDTDIPFDVNGKTVVLVDDVIFTGRTVRAAIDGLHYRDATVIIPIRTETETVSAILSDGFFGHFFIEDLPDGDVLRIDGSAAAVSGLLIGIAPDETAVAVVLKDN